MIFDVMVRQGFNQSQKQIVSVSRIRDISLNLYLRKVQEEGKYIISVIPLFRKKEQPVIDPIAHRTMIDPHGF